MNKIGFLSNLSLIKQKVCQSSLQKLSKSPIAQHMLPKNILIGNLVNKGKMDYSVEQTIDKWFNQLSRDLDLLKEPLIYHLYAPDSMAKEVQKYLTKKVLQHTKFRENEVHTATFERETNDGERRLGRSFVIGEINQNPGKSCYIIFDRHHQEYAKASIEPTLDYSSNRVGRANPISHLVDQQLIDEFRGGVQGKSSFKREEKIIVLRIHSSTIFDEAKNDRLQRSISQDIQASQVSANRSLILVIPELKTSSNR